MNESWPLKECGIPEQIGLKATEILKFYKAQSKLNANLSPMQLCLFSEEMIVCLFGNASDPIKVHGGYPPEDVTELATIDDFLYPRASTVIRLFPSSIHVRVEQELLNEDELFDEEVFLKRFNFRKLINADTVQAYLDHNENTLSIVGEFYDD